MRIKWSMRIFFNITLLTTLLLRNFPRWTALKSDIYWSQIQARIQKMLNRGAQTVKIIRLNRGAQIYFLVLHIRVNRGACAGCAPSKSAPANIPPPLKCLRNKSILTQPICFKLHKIFLRLLLVLCLSAINCHYKHMFFAPESVWFFFCWNFSAVSWLTAPDSSYSTTTGWILTFLWLRWSMCTWPKRNRKWLNIWSTTCLAWNTRGVSIYLMSGTNTHGGYVNTMHTHLNNRIKDLVSRFVFKVFQLNSNS